MATRRTQKRPSSGSRSNYNKNTAANRSKKSASSNNLKGGADSITAKNQCNQGIAIVLFCLSILLFCIIIIEGEHIWNMAHEFIWGVFGKSSFLCPIFLMYISIITAFDNEKTNIEPKTWFSISIIFLFSACFYIFPSKTSSSIDFFKELINLYDLGTDGIGAGLLSGMLGIPLVCALGKTGAEVTVIILLFAMIMFLSGRGLLGFFEFLFRPFRHSNKVKKEKHQERFEQEDVPYIPQKRNTQIDIPLGPENLPNHPVKADIPLPKKEKGEKLANLKKAFSKTNESNKKELDNEKADLIDAAEENSAAAAAEAFMKRKSISKDKAEIQKEEKPKAPLGLNDVLDEISLEKRYNFPPTSLLMKSVEADNSDIKNELQVSGQMLVDTLKSFNVQTKIVDISRGPAVTRYELQPASGVKISKITNLADDIALNLAASGVRIEAPIPGKAAVGIEVPNKCINIVKMRELIESKPFISAKSKLTVVLGQDISGNITLADLSKMPHLLIAGSTGSGKSVCINSFIISLLYKSTPDEVRLLMIDPKVVELGIYNGIPHLLVPVVTDPRKAAGALNWAVNEMLKRYKTFAEYNVRDLNAYNKMVAQKMHLPNQDEEPLKPMPQIVVIIDELADLMMAAPNEVEDAICRLAQMARAAGMHLVIATQRPSVDVITGIIKANIPSRIALAVSSQIDSRTILDMAGAEKLLGRGDMLFSPIGSQKPVRVQGCYVTDEEIESVVSYIKQEGKIDYDQNVIEEIDKNAVPLQENKGACDESAEDPMMNEAIECILEAGQASTSFLQRRLRIGYARAGRIIDQMEQMGIIGPHEGSKPRQVIITKQQFLERKNTITDKKD